MSFILDALKKADRERDLARVPTLSTVHVPVLMTGRRIGLWVTAAVLLVGGGISLWLWRPSPSAAPPAVTDSRAQTAAALPARPAAPAQSPAPARAVDAAPPASVAPVPSRPGAAEQPKAPSQPSPKPAFDPGPTPASPPQSSGSDLLAAGSGATRGGGRSGSGAQGDISPSAPPQTDLSLPQPAPVLQPPPIIPRPAPPVTTPAPVVPAPVPAQPQAPPQTAPSPQVSRPPAPAVPPSPPATPATPPSLIDAMAKMKLDLFVYTDVPADRMVIINGQRYVEGDKVAGLYLVESITKDGAVLTYQGEKALLRP